jgi:hypothetical protein
MIVGFLQNAAMTAHFTPFLRQLSYGELAKTYPKKAFWTSDFRNLTSDFWIWGTSDFWLPEL